MLIFLTCANILDLARRSADPSEILRAQLMGGSLRAIRRVAHAYDRELVQALRAGEVYDKEEPILTAIW